LKVRTQMKRKRTRSNFILDKKSYNLLFQNTNLNRENSEEK
jgi:hypothetical protein